MMEEKEFKYRGLVYLVSCLNGKYKFHTDYRNFDSPWVDSEERIHEEARRLIDIYVG